MTALTGASGTDDRTISEFLKVMGQPVTGAQIENDKDAVAHIFMSRWALGADLYSVKQREYDRLFGLENYNALTGHVTLYYASPWYNLNFLLSAGRYLAGDQGITVQATRRFASGIEVGAFFTNTNVSSAQFGEGSFDKGIIIRMPLGFTLPTNTQNEFGMIIRPVQRDGGQKLDGGSMLYEEAQRASQAEIETEAGR